MKKCVLAMGILLIFISCGKSEKQNKEINSPDKKELTTLIYQHDDSENYINKVDTVLLTKVAANLKIAFDDVIIKESSSIDYTDAIAFLIVSFRTKNDEGLKNIKGDMVYFLQRKYVFANKTDGTIIAEELDTNLSHYDDEVISFSKSYVYNKLIQLNETTQAIGFNVEVKGDGKINLYSNRTFTMVTLVNNKIKKILNGYPVRKTDGDPNGGGAFRMETLESDVSISSTKTNGFNDLIVSKTFYYEKKIKENLENGIKAKVEPVKTKKETQRIKYDGKFYSFKGDNEYRFFVI